MCPGPPDARDHQVRFKRLSRHVYCIQERSVTAVSVGRSEWLQSSHANVIHTYVKLQNSNLQNSTLQKKRFSTYLSVFFT